MIKIALVEGDETIVRQLKRFVNQFAEETKIEYTINVYDNGVDFASDYNPVYDVVFMNVKLPDIDGIEAARRLRQWDEEVILFFLTDKAQVAIKGYEVDAFDFLLTPLHYLNFAQKMKRFIKRIEKTIYPTFVLRIQDGFKRVCVRDIKYIEVMGHFLIYHTMGESIRVRGTLKHAEEKLVGYNFIKCNSCFLVNLRHIKGCSAMNIELEGVSLPISRRKKKEVSNKLMEYLAKESS